MKYSVKEELKKYIEEKIYPEYKLNGKSHGIEHVKEVTNRAFEIAEKYDVNPNMLYTAASFHDIADHISREKHEILSAKRMYEDKNLDKFFSNEEKTIIKEAIEDHRASSKRVPRTIYGKILASADKNTNVDAFFRRAMEYGVEHFQTFTRRQQIDRTYDLAVNKFGIDGYATSKYYVEDDKFANYLKKLQELIANRNEFDEMAGKSYDQIKKKENK